MSSNRLLGGLVVSVSLASGLFFDAAHAATATTTFSVTATVAATCTVSATNLAFGSYAGVVANATSTISVTCTNSTPYNVGLNPGTAAGATVTTRKMTGPGGATLGYGLFQGQVPAGQFVTPGAYTDTITATVSY